MGQRLTYYHQSQWITEMSEWMPPETITLRDAAGMIIPSTQMATMTLTIQDWSQPPYAIVNGVDGTVDVKNTRGCTLSTQGVFKLVLNAADTTIVNNALAYEIRRIMVEYTWPLVPTKSDALELFVVIRNLARRPAVGP